MSYDFTGTRANIIYFRPLATAGLAAIVKKLRNSKQLDVQNVL
jgi:hypothetical protein